MVMDLRVLFCFSPTILRDDKNAVLMQFGVKNSNSTKFDLCGLWFGRQRKGLLWKHILKRNVQS